MSQNATGLSSTSSDVEGSPAASSSTGIVLQPESSTLLPTTLATGSGSPAASSSTVIVFQPSESSTILPTTLATASGSPSITSSANSYQAGAAGATSTGVHGAGQHGSNGTYDAPTAQISPFLGGAADVGYDVGMLLCFTIAVISAVVLI
jgi:hypothetical protein